MPVEGPTTVVDDPDEIAEAVRRYGLRYRVLEPNPQRVVLRMAVDKVMSSSYMAR